MHSTIGTTCGLCMFESMNKLRRDIKKKICAPIHPSTSPTPRIPRSMDNAICKGRPSTNAGNADLTVNLCTWASVPCSSARATSSIFHGAPANVGSVGVCDVYGSEFARTEVGQRHMGGMAKAHESPVNNEIEAPEALGTEPLRVDPSV